MGGDHVLRPRHGAYDICLPEGGGSCTVTAIWGVWYLCTSCSSNTDTKGLNAYSNTVIHGRITPVSIAITITIRGLGYVRPCSLLHVQLEGN